MNETIRLINQRAQEEVRSNECCPYRSKNINDARRKLAELVFGKMLKIEGGDYKLCDGEETHCFVVAATDRRRHGGRGSEKGDEL